ncbi:MAG: DUF86 domain-containing protein [Deltaproteobacteria bacterium]|nr:DUF86 domain-containing protein [Deltaproteobacteria bacterium]
MKIDLVRIKKYLIEIKKYSMELRQLIEKNELTPGSIPLNAAKYILIELAEAMSNTIQHILAKDKGVPVSGYIDAILKAYENGIIKEDLFKRLKPFFDFRNSLIHRYWTVNDLRLIDNIKNGLRDFEAFTESIETYIRKVSDKPH